MLAGWPSTECLLCEVFLVRMNKCLFTPDREPRTGDSTQVLLEPASLLGSLIGTGVTHRKDGYPQAGISSESPIPDFPRATESACPLSEPPTFCILWQLPSWGRIMCSLEEGVARISGEDLMSLSPPVHRQV